MNIRSIPAALALSVFAFAAQAQTGSMSGPSHMAAPAGCPGTQNHMSGGAMAGGSHMAGGAMAGGDHMAGGTNSGGAMAGGASTGGDHMAANDHMSGGAMSGGAMSGGSHMAATGCPPVTKTNP